MRINKYLAGATGLSRRAADIKIRLGRVKINGQPAQMGSDVTPGDQVTLDGKPVTANPETTTVMLNKPVGYVVSRAGQGNRTIYDILPPELDHLKPVGRLDKDSSGLLLLTNDGSLANELTHPSRQKLKIYEVTLHKDLQPLHRQMISDHGVALGDGPSKFELQRQADGDDTKWIIQMREGRNRQIRRTFQVLGYEVTNLHRTHFGPYALGPLKSGAVKPV